jgi:hypothetical protein
MLLCSEEVIFNRLAYALSVLENNNPFEDSGDRDHEEDEEQVRVSLSKGVMVS